MTKISLFLLALLSAILMLSASCTKEGPIGPAGKDGVDGENGKDGTNGKDGKNGKDGEDGNANVVYSDWFEAGTWSSSGTLKYFEKSAPAVTESIINTGVVLCYTKLVGDDNNVRPLPAVFPDGLVFGFAVPEPGSLLFEARKMDGGTPYPSEDNQFRYVIISSNVAARGMSMMNFTDMSYEEILALCHIPEYGSNAHLLP